MFRELAKMIQDHARSAVSRFQRRPSEVWDGHAIYTTVHTDGEGGGPVAVTVEIEVLAPASLLVRRRRFFRWAKHRLPPINHANADSTLEVRGDDPAFARRLFDNDVAAATLPRALKRDEWIEISPTLVRVHRRVIDDSAEDANGAARLMAMAVVSALKLPPPSAPA